MGTTNFDNRSFAHNEENNVCCHDREFAQRFHEMFEADAAAAAIGSSSNAGGGAACGSDSQELVAAFLEEQT